MTPSVLGGFHGIYNSLSYAEDYRDRNPATQAVQMQGVEMLGFRPMTTLAVTISPCKHAPGAEPRQRTKHPLVPLAGRICTQSLKPQHIERRRSASRRCSGSHLRLARPLCCRPLRHRRHQPNPSRRSSDCQRQAPRRRTVRPIRIRIRPSPIRPFHQRLVHRTPWHSHRPTERWSASRCLALHQLPSLCLDRRMCALRQRHPRFTW